MNGAEQARLLDRARGAVTPSASFCEINRVARATATLHVLSLSNLYGGHAGHNLSRWPPTPSSTVVSLTTTSLGI